MALVLTFSDVFRIIVECFFLYYFFVKQLGYDNGKKIKFFLLLAGFTAGVFIIDATVRDTTVSTVIISAVKAVSALVFGSGIIRRILSGCIGAAAAVLCEMLTETAAGSSSGILLPPGAEADTILLCCIITAAVYWALAALIPQKNTVRSISFTVITAAVLVTCVFFGIYTISAAPAAAPWSCAFIFAVTAGVIFLFEKFSTVIKEKAAASNQTSQLNLEKENNQRIEKMVKVWRHDFHNYLEVLQIYIEKQDYEQLKKYLGETKKDFQQMFALSATGNNAIDTIISSKLLLANNKKTEVELHVQKMPNLPVSETKMCVLLGNLLDNAIEACEKISDPKGRYIDLTIKVKHGMIIIRVENSSVNDFSFEGDRLISSKQRENHGYGFERIKQIVNETGGIYEIKSGEGNFTVSVLLPLQQET